MESAGSELTIAVLENRQMIASILCELLTGAGHATRVVTALGDAAEVLPACQPGMLLVDMGVIHPHGQHKWQQLQDQAAALSIPVLKFSCSPLPEAAEEILILRSPGDFAMVVEWVETEWRKKQPYLGTLLIDRGLVTGEEVEAALRIQHELARVKRSYPLGDLLIRLGFLSAKDLDRVLEKDKT